MKNTNTRTEYKYIYQVAVRDSPRVLNSSAVEQETSLSQLESATTSKANPTMEGREMELVPSNSSSVENGNGGLSK